MILPAVPRAEPSTWHALATRAACGIGSYVFLRKAVERMRRASDRIIERHHANMVSRAVILMKNENCNQSKPC